MKKRQHPRRRPRIRAGAGLWGARLLTFPSLPSTNGWAMNHAADCREGDVIVAVRQTAGRGRFDRPWLSPANRCLTFSIVLKPGPALEAALPALTPVCALTVRCALQDFAIAATVKWPNDVMASGHKIAGILAERDSATAAVVVGIGLNVNMTPRDFRNRRLLQPATSMRMEKGRVFPVSTVLSLLCSRLEKDIAAWRRSRGRFPAREWKRHDFLAGKTLSVATAAGRVCGRYAGVNARGELRIRDQAERLHTFWSGDVAIP